MQIKSQYNNMYLLAIETLASWESELKILYYT